MNPVSMPTSFVAYKLDGRKELTIEVFEDFDTFTTFLLYNKDFVQVNQVTVHVNNIQKEE